MVPGCRWRERIAWALRTAGFREQTDQKLAPQADAAVPAAAGFFRELVRLLKRVSAAAIGGSSAMRATPWFERMHTLDEAHLDELVDQWFSKRLSSRSRRQCSA